MSNFRAGVLAVLSFVGGCWFGNDTGESQYEGYPPNSTGLAAICSSDSAYNGLGGAMRLAQTDADSVKAEELFFGAYLEGNDPWNVASGCFRSGVRVGSQTTVCRTIEAFDDDLWHVIMTDPSEAPREVPVHDVLEARGLTDGLGAVETYCPFASY